VPAGSRACSGRQATGRWSSLGFRGQQSVQESRGASCPPALHPWTGRRSRLCGDPTLMPRARQDASVCICSTSPRPTPRPAQATNPQLILRSEPLVPHGPGRHIPGRGRHRLGGWNRPTGRGTDTATRWPTDLVNCSDWLGDAARQPAVRLLDVGHRREGAACPAGAASGPGRPAWTDGRGARAAALRDIRRGAGWRPGARGWAGPAGGGRQGPAGVTSWSSA
jgi:hypothetical protein